MGSVYKRGPWWWVAFKVPGGGRVARNTMVASTEPKRAAQSVLAELERRLKLEQRVTTDRRTTVAEYALKWTAERKALKQTNAGKDLARLKLHVLPALGAMRLGSVTPGDIRRVVTAMRVKQLAPRTVLNTYGLVHRLFADAVAEELVLTTPATLHRRDLPKKADKDPRWRSGARYTREEAQLLMTAPAVPADRRVVYALAFLTGMREGEIAALTWASLDETAEPLARLLVSHSYTRQNGIVKETKSGQPREVPVHPELLPVLREWRARGFASFFGREPRPDDLVVPNRAGGFRTDLNYLEGLDLDLKALQLRHRDMHSMRRTFVSCGREDVRGSDAVLKTITHDQVGSVYDGYTIFTFTAKCEAVAQLKLSTRPVQVVTARAKAAGGPETVTATSFATQEGNMDVETKEPADFSAGSVSAQGGIRSLIVPGSRGVRGAKSTGSKSGEGQRGPLLSVPCSNVADAPISKELSNALADFKARGDRGRLAARLRVVLAQLRPRSKAVRH